MKKVKIMLLSLALFAVVGGALAFKVKFDQRWCVAPTYGNGFTCTTLVGPVVHTTTCGGNVVPNQKNDPEAVFSCTSVPDAEKDCDVTCPIHARIKSNI